MYEIVDDHCIALHCITNTAFNSWFHAGQLPFCTCQRAIHVHVSRNTLGSFLPHSPRSHALHLVAYLFSTCSRLTTGVTCCSPDLHTNTRVSNTDTPMPQNHTLPHSPLPLPYFTLPQPRIYRDPTTSTQPLNNQTYLLPTHQHADRLEPRERSQGT